MLTAPQVELLVWIIEKVEGKAFYEEMLGGHQTINGEGGVERPLDPSDLRELVAQDLVRHVGGVHYEVTNEGRAFYQELKNPPQEGPPPGFRPE